MAIAIFAAAWHFSDVLIRPVPRVPLESGILVTTVDDSTITLVGSERARKGGAWFLEWPGGSAVAGELIDADHARVVRRFRALDGRPAAGSGVDLGPYLFSGDPRRSLGMRFVEVSISSSFGVFPAWFVPGTRDTWVVFVHGMGAGRGESLRLLPVVTGLGFPALVTTWRNGPGAPRSKDGLYHLGASEWEDLDAAVRHARRLGARRVVLVGYSMGGAIVAEFMRRSDLAGAVSGVVLDAPALDWHAAVQLGANQRGRGAMLLAPLAEQVVSLRTGFRWSASGPRAWREQFRTPAPILLFHGTADPTVPIEPSEAFARALGDRVTFVTTEGAGHVQSWNFDPERYGRTLSEWLTRTVATSSP